MKIENFSQWWDQNHLEYEKIGINRIVAKTIWDAACDAFGDLFLKTLERKI